MAVPADMKCSTCLYHDRTDDTCHLRAPALVSQVPMPAPKVAAPKLPVTGGPMARLLSLVGVRPNPKAPDDVIYQGYWPGVRLNDWCGEHKANS